MHWEIERRCPECEWRETGIYEQEIVEWWDELLEAGTDSLIRELELIVSEEIDHEADRLREALAAGALLPEDF